jgi:hypothetical protein
MGILRAKRDFAAGIAAFSILLAACGIAASAAPADAQSRRGFFISAQTVLTSGLTFPATYFTYKSIGGANVPDSLYLGQTAASSSRPGFGLSLGYEWRFSFLKMTAEIEYSLVTAANGREILNDDVYYGATFTRVHTERPFSQNGRSLSLLDMAFSFGIFPFRSLNLGFSLSAGAGYGRQSFTSPAVADAVSRGFDYNNLRSTTTIDFGDYDGGGTWHRGSLIYFVGLGAEFELSSRLSLRFDYKYIASSYSRENVLISSGAVNVYLDKVDYEYTVGNKFSLGLSFRL